MKDEDTGEKTNKAALHSEVVDAFRAELKDIILNGRSTEGIPQKNDGPEYWPQMNLVKNSK